MNPRYISEKEPIERLLGMAGAVQYLEHALKDELTYSVWVKTKTGTKQITIPIEAVRLIQSRKPTDQVVASIKRQLALEPAEERVDESVSPRGEEAARPAPRLWRWLLGVLGK